MRTINLFKCVFRFIRNATSVRVLAIALAAVAVLPGCRTLKTVESHAVETTIAGAGGAAAVLIPPPVGPVLGLGFFVAAAVAGEHLRPTEKHADEPKASPPVNVTGNNNRVTVTTKSAGTGWTWYYTVICALGLVLIVPRWNEVFSGLVSHLAGSARVTALHLGALVGGAHTRPEPGTKPLPQLEPAVGEIRPPEDDGPENSIGFPIEPQA